MPKYGIIALLLIAPMTAGCATPYVRQWESQLWQVPNETDGATPEFGQFKAEDLDFGIICTEFRQVGNLNNRIIGIGVSCRNDAREPMSLPLNPIQVVDASKILIQPLSLNQVMYKFYGGGLREDAQIERLAESSKPLAAYGNSILENVLLGVINAYREYERGAIITEFHRKEALPYDLYYKRFTPTVLPAEVSTVWVTYYPFATDTITIMFHGGNVEDGVLFQQPPPPPPTAASDPPPSNARRLFMSFLAGVTIWIFVVSIT
ncbi:MAG: hypothetical protein OXP71_02345 [Candidatus Poribacteria bacterium]|nr:hypothetical protein [Candidatus Poribacteria bacterium]